MNYKEFLRSWSPWHLRKRIADEIAYSADLEYRYKALKDQRTENYTGLMTECEKLKEENERLKSENRDWELVVNSMVQNRVKERSYINKGDTNEQK